LGPALHAATGVVHLLSIDRRHHVRMVADRILRTEIGERPTIARRSPIADRILRTEIGERRAMVGRRALAPPQVRDEDERDAMLERRPLERAHDARLLVLERQLARW